jgi:hypothetical protein
MAFVGADGDHLRLLARRCDDAGDELGHVRSRLGAELSALGIESSLPRDLERVEGGGQDQQRALARIARWLPDPPRSTRHRADDAERASSGGSHHRSLFGSMTHAASSFGQGAWDGTVGAVKGAVGLGKMAVHSAEEPGRLAAALFDGGASGLADEARSEFDRELAMVKGLGKEAVHLGKVAQHLGPTGPLYFAVDTYRQGFDKTLSEYSYEAGTLVPDAAIALATDGAAEAVAARRLARAEAEASAVAATVAVEAEATLPATFAELPEPAGWARREKLVSHFVDHGDDFGALTPSEYVEQSKRLLDEARGGILRVKVDPDRRVIRVFDPATGRFGSFNPDGSTRTYFRPKSTTYFDRQPGTELRSPSLRS